MLAWAVLTAPRTARWLADPPQPPPGEGPEWGKAAPIGALVLILLGIAVWLLMRNMSKHLRKVRDMADAELDAGANDAANGVAGHQAAEASGVDVEEADHGDADIDLTKHEPHTGG
ncbi:MAG: hypothetical protein M3Y77_06300 [Actinomycetota bacterium]|nr:hypothetical protein [Actinomycetota bacterium]